MVTESETFLQDINAKQERAWERLYTEYYSPLCCYALKILKDKEQGMDVVQGVMIRLWEIPLHFEDLPSLRGYLYQAVYHNCLKILRNRNAEEKYKVRQEEERDCFQSSNFSAVIEEEIVRKLRRVIGQMPKKRREVMLLCLEDKKVEEISKQLGISVNTVKKHKKEAYQYIRKMLSPDVLILFCLFPQRFK